MPLLIAGAVIALAAALILLRAWWQETDGGTQRLLGAWSLSNLCIAASCAIFASRPHLPETMVIVGGNGAILLSLALIWAGLRALRGRRGPWWLLLAPVAIWSFACAVPSFSAALGARVLLSTGMVYGLLVLLTLECLRAQRELGLRSLNDLLVVAGLLFVRTGFRVMDVLIAQAPVVGFVSSLLTLVAATGLGFAGLGIARERAARRDTANQLATAQRADVAEESLQHVFETMAQGIMSFAPDGRLRFANLRAIELLGLPPDLAQPGRPAREIRAWQQAHGVLGRADRPGPSPPVEERVLRDGRVLEVRTVLPPKGGILRTYTDITDRKRAEREVQAALDRARAAEATRAAAIDNISQGIVLLAPDGTILLTNDRALDLIGAPEELLRPGCRFAPALAWLEAQGLLGDDPEVHALAREAVERMATGPTVYERPTTRGRMLEVRTTPVPGGGAVRTFADITERKEAERSVQAALERARAAEATRTTALENISQGIMLIAPDGTILLSNDRAVDLVSLPAELLEPGRNLREGLAWLDRHGAYDSAPALRTIAHESVERMAEWPSVYERATSRGRMMEVRTTPMPGGGAVRTYTDVTERHRAERDLHAALERTRAAEADLAAALANISQGVLMVDADGIIRVLNRQATELAEVPASVARPGVSMHEVIAAQVASGIFATEPRILDSARDGTVASYIALGRYERRRSDGRIIEVRTTPLPGGGGVRTFTDISDRKRAEQEMAASLERMREAEATLSAAIENVPHGIALIDANFRLRLFNRRVQELFGIPDALCAPGTDCADILRWEIANGNFGGDPVSIARVERSIAERRITFGMVERHLPDGCLLELRTTLLPDGGALRTYTDVTERRARERALEEAEATLSAAIGAMPQGIVLLGPDLRIRLVNRQVAELLGFPPGVIRPGADFADALRWDLESGRLACDPKALARTHRVLERRKLPSGLSERHLPDGRILEQRTIALPDGGAIRTYTDITERRQRELAAVGEAPMP